MQNMSDEAIKSSIEVEKMNCTMMIGNQEIQIIEVEVNMIDI